MRTRGSHLYHIYSPSRQRSQREHEHFNNVWQLQSIIVDRLIGEQYDWVDAVWIDYCRMPSGLFMLMYTIFNRANNYKIIFQNVTNLTDVEIPIGFLEKNLPTIKF